MEFPTVIVVDFGAQYAQLIARRIREAEGGERRMPIVALTANALHGESERCLAAGMDDYLTKPLQVAALAQALEKWIPAAPAAPPVAAPAAAPAEAPLMDFGRLEEFKEFDDADLSMTREVIALFLADTPQRLDAIARAAAAGDASALATAAHALKGAAGNVGALALHQAAGELEALAREGLPTDAVARAQQLQALWERTRPVLEGWG